MTVSFTTLGPSKSKRARAAFAVTAATMAVLAFAGRARSGEEVFTGDGARRSGRLLVSEKRWTLNGKALDPAQIVWVRFPGAATEPVLNEGVFLRGGLLLRGRLVRYQRAGKEGEATIRAPLLGDKEKKISALEVAGAFFPPPESGTAGAEARTGATPVFALSRYVFLLRGALHLVGGTWEKPDRIPLWPGRRRRYILTNGEALPGRLAGLQKKRAVFEVGEADYDTPLLARLRLVECETPPLPATPAERSTTPPEMWIRLRGGELLRGTVEKLDAATMVVRTRGLGELHIPRSESASVFPVGGTGRNGKGPVWAADLKPAVVKRTALFDAEFPPRRDSSVADRLMRLDGAFCERGWSVHSKTVLTFTVPGGRRHFVAFVGLDERTEERGRVAVSIAADGKTRWRAADIRSDTPAKFISLPLGGARRLTLTVDFGPDGDAAGDHFDWAWAAFTP